MLSSQLPPPILLACRVALNCACDACRRRLCELSVAPLRSTGAKRPSRTPRFAGSFGDAKEMFVSCKCLLR
eukprot:76534-Pleurochrysis_carterae.AAC.1